jgi:hypothetical protein
MAQFQVRDVSVEELADVLDSLNKSGGSCLAGESDLTFNNEGVTKNIISMGDYLFTDDDRETC